MAENSRLPRQNPVFMFLPSGMKHGSKTVFSVPGATSGENPSSTILKENLVVHHSSPGKKSKSRQASALFRLPTAEEEERFLMADIEEMSTIPETELSQTKAAPKAPISSPSKRYPELKASNSAAINRLFGIHVDLYNEKFLNDSYVVHEKLNTGKELSLHEMEKCLKWVRTTSQELFWTPFQKLEAKGSSDNWSYFETVYSAATSTAIKFSNMMDKVMKRGDHIVNGERRLDCVGFLCGVITGILLSSDKQRLISQSLIDKAFDTFYTIGFKTLVNVTSLEAECNEEKMDVDGVDRTCEFCSELPCVCQKVAPLFVEANLSIQALGLLDELAGPRIYHILKKDMVTKVEDIGTDQTGVSYINDLLKWLKLRETVWIETVYPQMRATETLEKMSMRRQFKRMLLEIYGQSIINNLFSVIIEFPESQPMLEDLKMCIKEANLRQELVSNFKSSLERRLLNAGVNTNEVLVAYIDTVRALKFVDPSGILVQLVTPPVREYLKHREETVRVILLSLTEESGELSDELARNPSGVDKRQKFNMSTWKTWEPDPIDVPKDKHNLRKSDLIEALVSIYGTKTVFIDEYRALLADRLLKLPMPGSLTREIKCLELLKLRFGESDLQKCEVMLKDVSDSQRLNTRLYEDEGAVLAEEVVKVTGLIVSAQFWPAFKQEELNLPEPVAKALEKYTKAFEMIKGNRTLEWQRHIGSVDLEIEHDGKTLTMSVTPMQATILWHFQDKQTWSVEELAKVTNTSASFITSKIGFWVSKGIIANAGQGVYSLVDSFDYSSTRPVDIANKYIEEAESDSPMASTSSQRATELQMFWSYIEAMLTNLESLPLARIHSMLKLFATVECSSDELQRFLDEKVSQNHLVYSAGQYQLPK